MLEKSFEHAFGKKFPSGRFPCETLYETVGFWCLSNGGIHVMYKFFTRISFDVLFYTLLPLHVIAKSFYC